MAHTRTTRAVSTTLTNAIHHPPAAHGPAHVIGKWALGLQRGSLNLRCGLGMAIEPAMAMGLRSEK